MKSQEGEDQERNRFEELMAKVFSILNESCKNIDGSKSLKESQTE